MASNFQKVVDFNTQFGVLESKELKPKSNILTQDPNTVEHCLKLIREEMKELEEAVVDKDFVEVVDALTDILYVVYGAGARFGIDLDKVFDIVHDNNMSKLCKSENEAKKSVEDYIECRTRLLEIENNMDLYYQYKFKLEEAKKNMDELNNNKNEDNKLKMEDIKKNIKFCEENKTELEKNYNNNMEFYEKNKHKLAYDSPAYRQAPNGNDWVVYNKSTKKVLKSIEYKDVDLRDVCK